MPTMAVLKKQASKQNLRCRSGMTKAYAPAFINGTISPMEKENCSDFWSRIKTGKSVKIPSKKSKRASPGKPAAVKGSPPIDDAYCKSKNCEDRVPDDKKMREWQQRIVRFIGRANQKGLLVAHGTGCGKTLAAGVASQCFLDKYPDRRVIFVGPAGLIPQFRRDTVRRDLGGCHKFNYMFFSFQRLGSLYKASIQKKDPSLFPSALMKGGMLVVDEIHNARTRIKGLDRTGIPKSGVAAQALFTLSTHARKALLLSATPFYNNVQDFVNIINILHGELHVSTRGRGKDQVDTLGKSVGRTPSGIKTRNTLIKFLAGKVDFIKSCADLDKKSYPAQKEKYVCVPMTKAYEHAYRLAVQSSAAGGGFGEHPEKFYNAYRRAVNALDASSRGETYYSQKLRKAVGLIRRSARRSAKRGTSSRPDPKSKFQKTVFYTTWIKSGVEPLIQYLGSQGIKAVEYSGRKTPAERKQIQEDFNNNKFDALIITAAGGEGLDLKGVRNLVVLDPVWNEAGLRQIIGRAVRYRSHSHLPKNDQKVRVYKMVLTYPGVDTDCISAVRAAGIKGNQDWTEMTGDQLVYDKIIQKEAQGREIDKILEECSRGRGVAKPRSRKNDHRRSKARHRKDSSDSKRSHGRRSHL